MTASQTSQTSPASLASQGCWTCKKRKIGCDKGRPSCNNCFRTGRRCLGYGLRLVWPDKKDGRRRQPILPPYTAPEQHDDDGCEALVRFDHGKQFLNISYDDIERSRRKLGRLTLNSNPNPRPERQLNPLPELPNQEAGLLHYYAERIARMISTIDANNGFRQELVPMAVARNSFATESLLNAIFALSAFHRHGTGAALCYKYRAIKFLNWSIQKESRHIESQIAASMMLCVYNVFDESEGNWDIHLDGSRDLLHTHAKLKGSPLEYNFLNTWFLYHEILGAFSQPHKHQYEGTASLELIKGNELDKTLIIGSLGCSIEIMEIIHHINQLRSIASRKLSGYHTQTSYPTVMWTCQGLQDRLCRLEQRLPTNYKEQTKSEQDKIQLTAQLYRIAAVLYLRATCFTAEAPEQTSMWLDLAFDTLENLEICTSPWPLFVVACESQNDQQRIMILSALDRMDQDRKIGNVFVLRSLIENFWKQQDLQADTDRTKPLRWWELMNSDTAAPWFI
ncbi:fungal-specific transcription factor domain-domain-containing protein [Coniella lustricola]|uniref:Fungal-specific transcription factor domain-domain-containing protein n=1 Tax=Coniella lustricola TaxID=2025994 RepID=A0A2T3ACA4_9PEZI|nr:fungal-specific transcription factor domain-domain-containing protein [Coniella lustricola]